MVDSTAKHQRNRASLMQNPTTQHNTTLHIPSHTINGTFQKPPSRSLAPSLTCTPGSFFPPPSLPSLPQPMCPPALTSESSFFFFFKKKEPGPKEDETGEDAMAGDV